MALDPYESCPCGSGKKFKWCCQEIYGDIEEAFRLESGGQHDAATRKLSDVVAAHPGNPEAHGRQAQLLVARGKIDEAELALEKAFAINPNYPFGLLLRGQLRAAEGELVGGLLLFRRAANAFAPDAHDILASIHEFIAELELKLNRPIAARAALKRASLFAPDNAELRQAIDALFGAKTRFPASACKDYAFRRPAAASANWDRALADAATGRLADVQRVFELWSKKHPEDAAAWYNLGLVHAWLGENAAAVDALSQYVERETDERLAGEAWTIAEILRCGVGMESEADVVEYRAVGTIRDPNALVAWLQEWERSNRLLVLGSDRQSGVLSGMILEESSSLVLSGASAPPAKLGSYFLVAGDMLQLWHPVEASLEKAFAEVQAKLGPGLEQASRAIGPAHFGDVVAEALLFPTAATTQLDAETKVRNHAQQYFEDTWVHRPLKSLLGTPPIDAAGHPTLRKRLRGVIQFIEECAGQTTTRLYDFDRLRHKLGLDGTAPVSVAMDAPKSDQRDWSAMNAAELAAIDLQELPANELQSAFRASIQLDAQELAGRIAAAWVARPVAESSGDRFPAFQHLISSAQANRDFDAALEWIDAGEKADCEGNEGRHRNDYELRRGQLLAKRGDASAAADAFDRLLARIPDDLQAAGVAAEAMLGAKQTAAATRFAEHGLNRAREAKNRDMEGYFLELADAARRQAG
jgi:tetratricopeptide (TPR) repeat protein